MTKTTKIAMIGDIIASKKLKERAETQKILSTILSKMNTTYSEHFESHLTITLGDEFQCIVSDVKTAFILIDRITLELQITTKKQLNDDISLRWGIGIGGLITPIIDKKVSIGADGPAYWHAREAIESVHENDDYGLLNEKIITEQDDDLFYNSIIRLQNVIRNQWTYTQKETVYHVLLADEYNDVNNQKVTEALSQGLEKSLSAQTVSKRIISTQIKQYIQSRRLLAEQIEKGCLQE
ncbi:SatD family protein [Alkalibacterium kapii]|uniref:DNA-binding protein n=1 Tax=Alkalibacterium kapii TaxID=426704 RepID=A0A511ATZ8_9LACT|nr:SatD family protein [Alkalibacterium kapii]GEK91192.1 DNA-binding protein [Alkalibacterium kapii]